MIRAMLMRLQMISRQKKKHLNILTIKNLKSRRSKRNLRSNRMKKNLKRKSRPSSSRTKKKKRRWSKFSKVSLTKSQKPNTRLTPMRRCLTMKTRRLNIYLEAPVRRVMTILLMRMSRVNRLLFRNSSQKKACRTLKTNNLISQGMSLKRNLTARRSRLLRRLPSLERALLRML